MGIDVAADGPRRRICDGNKIFLFVEVKVVLRFHDSRIGDGDGFRLRVHAVVSCFEGGDLHIVRLDRRQFEAVAKLIVLRHRVHLNGDGDGEADRSCCADRGRLFADIRCYGEDRRTGFRIRFLRYGSVNSFSALKIERDGTGNISNRKFRREGIFHRREQLHLALALLPLRDFGEGQGQIQDIVLFHDGRHRQSMRFRVALVAVYGFVIQEQVEIIRFLQRLTGNADAAAHAVCERDRQRLRLREVLQALYRQVCDFQNARVRNGNVLNIRAAYGSDIAGRENLVQCCGAVSRNGIGIVAPGDQLCVFRYQPLREVFYLPVKIDHQIRAVVDVQTGDNRGQLERSKGVVIRHVNIRQGGFAQIQRGKPRAAGNVQTGDGRGNRQRGQAREAGGVQRRDRGRQRQPGQIRLIVSIADLHRRERGVGGQIKRIQFRATGNVQRGYAARYAQAGHAARDIQAGQARAAGDIQRRYVARNGQTGQACAAGDIQGRYIARNGQTGQIGAAGKLNGLQAVPSFKIKLFKIRCASICP